MLCKNCWEKIPSHIQSNRYCSLRCELASVPVAEDSAIEGIDDTGRILKKLRSIKES